MSSATTQTRYLNFPASYDSVRTSHSTQTSRTGFIPTEDSHISEASYSKSLSEASAISVQERRNSVTVTTDESVSSGESGQRTNTTSSYPMEDLDMIPLRSDARCHESPVDITRQVAGSADKSDRSSSSMASQLMRYKQPVAQQITRNTLSKVRLQRRSRSDCTIFDQHAAFVPRCESALASGDLSYSVQEPATAYGDQGNGDASLVLGADVNNTPSKRTEEITPYDSSNGPHEPRVGTLNDHKTGKGSEPNMKTDLSCEDHRPKVMVDDTRNTQKSECAADWISAARAKLGSSVRGAQQTKQQRQLHRFDIIINSRRHKERHCEKRSPPNMPCLPPQLYPSVKGHKYFRRRMPVLTTRKHVVHSRGWVENTAALQRLKVGSYIYSNYCKTIMYVCRPTSDNSMYTYNQPYCCL